MKTIIAVIAVIAVTLNLMGCLGANPEDAMGGIMVDAVFDLDEMKSMGPGDGIRLQGKIALTKISDSIYLYDAAYGEIKYGRVTVICDTSEIFVRSSYSGREMSVSVGAVGAVPEGRAVRFSAQIGGGG